MFSLHVIEKDVVSVAEAMKYSLFTWGLLVLSVAIIFLVVFIISKFRNK